MSQQNEFLWKVCHDSGRIEYSVYYSFVILFSRTPNDSAVSVINYNFYTIYIYSFLSCENKKKLNLTTTTMNHNDKLLYNQKIKKNSNYK